MGSESAAASRAGYVAVAALFAAALAVLAVVDPSTAKLLPPCPFRLATGLLCPACGTGRALHALLHGEVVKALRYNPLAVAALPILVSALAAKTVRPGKPLPRLPRPVVILVLVLLAATLVLRNAVPALAPP